MLKFLCDENFNGDIFRGLWLRDEKLDLLRVQDVGLRGKDDDDVLDWAAQNDRLLLTHDRATLPNFAFQRVIAGRPMPGVIVVNDRLPIGQIIDEVILIANCSEPADWLNRVLYLPL
jgi:predicted nuclease of predicted toxin-antitoxin system